MLSVSMPPSADNSAVYSLLAAVSDPKAAKARLDEITKAKATYERVFEENKQLSAKIEADKSAAESALKKVQSEQQLLDKSLEKHLDNVARQEKTMSDKIAETASLHATASALMESAKTTQQLADERSSKLVAAENDMQMRLKDLAKNEADYVARSRILENKLATLKSLAD